MQWPTKEIKDKFIFVVSTYEKYFNLSNGISLRFRKQEIIPLLRRKKKIRVETNAKQYGSKDFVFEKKNICKPLARLTKGNKGCSNKSDI